MKPELQQHLDNLVGVVPGIDQEGHPAHNKYLELKAAMEALNDIPKQDWGKKSTIEIVNRAVEGDTINS